MRIALTLFAVLALAGCGNRTSLPEAEAVTAHTIATTMEPGAAFLATEEALADAWSSWKDVNQLRQPETGTLGVKGLFPYTDITGSTAANVAVKVKVKPKTIAITYTIDRNREGWFPSESAVQQMRDQFAAMTARVAKAVDGTVDAPK